MTLPNFDPWAAIGRPGAEMGGPPSMEGAGRPPPASTLVQCGRPPNMSAPPAAQSSHEALVANWRARIMAMQIDDDPSAFWDQAIVDARQGFLQGWVRQAAALGWSVIDLFGVHPMAPADRLDCMGLVPILRGRAILAVMDAAAVIDVRGGARLTFRRADHDPYGMAVPMWEVGPRCQIGRSE